MTTPSSSQGCLLQLSIASIFTTVGLTKNVELPNGEVQFFEANSTDAGTTVPDGELVGQSTPGEAGCELYYDPADAVHKIFPVDASTGGAYRDWKIVMPDTGSSVVTFNGSVKSFAPKAAAKEGFMANLKIKLRTAATYPA